MNLKGVKRNKIVYAVIFFFIAYAGYASFRSAKKTWNTKKLAEAKIIQAFPALCEAGKWIEISKVKSEDDEYEGIIILKKKGSGFSDAEEKIIFAAPIKNRLDYFSDREIKVEGVKKKKAEVAVRRVKCVGAEADPKALAERRRLMNYIASNINNLVPETSRNGAWETTGFYFANDSDVYVAYGLPVPENPADKKKDSEVAKVSEEVLAERHLWLIRTAKLERSKPVIEELAYLEEGNGENIQDGKVLRGENIHQDAMITLIYKLDKVTNQWKLQ